MQRYGNKPLCTANQPSRNPWPSPQAGGKYPVRYFPPAFLYGFSYHASVPSTKDTECGYKRHRASIPFRKGCHDSGGVCITLAEPAQITKVLFKKIIGLSTYVSRYIPPGSAVPLSKGDSQLQSICLSLNRCKRHRGSVPFRKGCHDSGGVCIKLAKPAQITKVLLSIIYGLSTSVSRYIPPGSAVPLSKGDAR